MTTETQYVVDARISNYRDRDIFRWRYKKLPENPFTHDPYWCTSQIGILDGKHLYDTYWLYLPSWKGSWHDFGHGKNWLFYNLDKVLDLEYLGNFDELENVNEYMEEYYDSKDIVNLNHSNSSKGNFYIRKGAKRSKEKMLHVVKFKMENAWAQIQASSRDYKRYAELESLIEKSDDLDRIYI